MKSVRIPQLRVSQEIAEALAARARQLGVTQSEAHRRILSDALMKRRPAPIIPIVGTIDPEGKVQYFEKAVA